jgi:hypothetical protein
LVALAGFLLASLPAIAWGLDFEPGKWEITSKVEMPGMPAPMPPVSVTQCMTEQDPVPTKSAGSESCQVKELKIEGNSASWKMKCNQPGGEAEGTGQITYHGDRFEGTTKMSVGPPEAKVVVTTKITGRRISACD